MNPYLIFLIVAIVVLAVVVDVFCYFRLSGRIDKLAGTRSLPVIASPIAALAGYAGSSAPVKPYDPVKVAGSPATKVLDALRCETCSVCRHIAHAYSQFTNYKDNSTFTICHDCIGKGITK